MTISSGGSAIPTGPSPVPFIVPFNGTITAAVFEGGSGETGAAQFDIWKATDGSTVPTNTNSITASAPVAVSAARYSRDTTLTGWTTSVSKGNRLWLNCDSNGGAFKNVIVSLELTKT